MKVAYATLLLTLFYSKGEQPPQLVVWGGVLVVSCLGYEEFLKRKKGKVRYLTKIFLSKEGNTLFRPRWYDFRAFSSFRSLAYWDSSLWALPALFNKEFRLGPGKRWQQQKGRGPCSCCVRCLLSQ